MNGYLKCKVYACLFFIITSLSKNATLKLNRYLGCKYAEHTLGHTEL